MALGFQSDAFQHNLGFQGGAATVVQPSGKLSRSSDHEKLRPGLRSRLMLNLLTVVLALFIGSAEAGKPKIA